MVDMGRSSILVHILVVALCLTAFGFAIAAERRRSTVLILTHTPASCISTLHPASINQQGSKNPPPFLICTYPVSLGRAEIWCWLLYL
jgi:hypothetical protein